MLISLPSVHGAEATDTQPALLSLTNTMDTSTTFRIFRRRPDNNQWDAGSAYAYTNGVALLRALEESKPWDRTSYAAVYGLFHAHTPSLEITIDWSRAKTDQKTNSITLCYGNRLFWYGNSVYQIPEASHEVADKLFPKNKGG
jgi:hypothetical protein